MVPRGLFDLVPSGLHSRNAGSVAKDGRTLFSAGGLLDHHVGGPVPGQGWTPSVIAAVFCRPCLL